MRFNLLDRVLDAGPDRLVAVKHVAASEDYLADHFPTFPIMPGVFMLQTMVHAAAALLERRGHPGPFVLGAAKAIRYGAILPPGSSLQVTVSLLAAQPDGSFDFRGEGVRLTPAAPAAADDRIPPTQPQVAVSGRFSLRPPLPPRA